MRLSDIMGAMDLSVYPQVGLIIFLGVFAAVTLRVLGRRNADRLQKFASMPLDDSTPTS